MADNEKLPWDNLHSILDAKKVEILEFFVDMRGTWDYKANISFDTKNLDVL